MCPRVLLSSVLALTIFLMVGTPRPAAADDRPLHQVRIGPIASRADADDIVGVLEREAIAYYVLPSGDDGSVEISVGVFSVLENAQQMESRIRALGIEPSRIISTGTAGQSAVQTPPTADSQKTDLSPAGAPESAPAFFEVRYGWFTDRDRALETHRALVEKGFEPRLLVFSESGRTTLGLDVFDDSADAQRQVDMLQKLGFPDGRVYPVGPDEAQRRRLAGTGEVQPQPMADAPSEAIDLAQSDAPEEVTPAPAETEPAAVAAAPPVVEPAPAIESTLSSPPASSRTTPPMEPDVPYQLELSDAIAYALAHSPELEGEQLNLQLSETDLRRAWGLVQPKIFFEHQSTRNDPDTVEYFNRLPDGANLLLQELGLPPTVPPFMYEDAHHTQVLMTQNLFAGGGNRFRIDGARAHRDASRSHRDDQQAEILMRVLQAFFNLARQAEVVGLRDESLERAQRSLESVQRRFSLGLVARADVLRWQVQVSGERVQLIQAQNLHEVGLEQFKRLIGYPPQSPLQLVFPTARQIDQLMNAGTAELGRDVRTADEGWLEEHPAVAAASQDADAARYLRKATSSDFWPKLDLDGSVGYLENDTIELDEFMQWSVRLRLSFPLWDGGARVQNRAEAKTREDLADLALRVVRDELFVQDRSVVADLRADLAALENARAAVDQATETMESVTNKAALGLADYIQRIDAQVILTQSQVAETSARYQFVIDLFRWWRIRDPARLENGTLQ